MIVERTGRRAHGAGGRVAAALLLLPAVLALVAVGCGDDSSETDDNEAYANSVCSAIGSWEQQVTGLVPNPSAGLSQASVQAKITQVESATATLRSEIKAIPPPGTSEGEAAQQQLDQLTAELTVTVASLKSAAAQLPSDASGTAVAGAVVRLAPQVENLASTAQSTVQSLADTEGSLASAFESADSCQSLGS